MSSDRRHDGFGFYEILSAGTRQHQCQGDETPQPKPFALPGSQPHYTPDRPGQVNHIRLDLEIELDHQRVMGICSLRLDPIRKGIRTLRLDAVDLDIQSVHCNGIEQLFSYDRQHLDIELQTPTQIGTMLDLQIHYQIQQPQRGIYFIHPTPEYPQKPIQVWTQGEDEDSRYWFPCFDYPGQLATSELWITVPNPYQAISNGELVNVQAIGSDRTCYHWSQTQVHPTYLMTLAVGNFAKIQDEWQGKPVTYYVEKGRESDARRSMGKTPAMIEFFSTVFGYPYPYPKYAQICVADFIFGGMENTSTTLLTDRCLLDERATLDDLKTETLVAHELAHQWFGDLIVIKHWSHAWIKEGMATYAEILWDQFSDGPEKSNYHRYQDQQFYLSEDRERYRRPIVTHVYKEPIELYDAHLYEKGSCIYHMLRHQLGDDLFQKAIHHFVQTYAHRTVETIDLIRAIDAATGHNVMPLFDQYVFRGGHPEFKVTYTWDPETQMAKLTVVQTQAQRSLSTQGQGTQLPPTSQSPLSDNLFDLTIPIAFGFDQGKVLKIISIQVQSAEQTFYIPLDRKPEFVSFDHGNHTLKTVELELPVPELKAQLLYGSPPDVIARILAAQALAKKGGVEAVKALEQSLVQDRFWGVKVEVCKALGSMNIDQAFEVLRQTVSDSDPHVRRAAIEALANEKKEINVTALLPFVEKGDPSYQVEAAAAKALGTIAGGSIDQKPEASDVIQILKQVLETRSGWNEVVRSGAIAGLAQLKHSETALDLVLDYTILGVPQPLRLAAIRALGTYASDQENSCVLERLRELSREPFFFTQIAVITALSQLNTAKAIPILQRMGTQDGRVARRIHEAIDQVQSNIGRDRSAQQLRQELDQLKKTHQDLLSRLEALEADREKTH